MEPTAKQTQTAITLSPGEKNQKTRALTDTRQSKFALD
jgi:hypothetical protein